jgi:sugar lactone lactonase YvrE
MKTKITLLILLTLWFLAACTSAVPATAPVPTNTTPQKRSIGSDADPLVGPSGLALDIQGNLYVIDAGHDRIVKYDPDGKQLAQWGSHGQGDGQFFFGGEQDPSGSGSFIESYGKLVVDRQGNVYVVDTKNVRIQKFDSHGKFLSKWGGPGTGAGQFGTLVGIAIDSQANIYTAENSPVSRIQKFDRNGIFLLQWQPHPVDNGLAFGPVGIAIDGQDHVYLLDRATSTVQRASTNGQWLENWPLLCGQNNAANLVPDSLTLDQANNLYVADHGVLRICKYDGRGQLLAKWDAVNDLGFHVANLVVGVMNGIAADAGGHVYVAMSEANRVALLQQP